MIRSAFISPDGLFRYSLTRIWNQDMPLLVFVMLNPSIADGLVDDPTLRKCIAFAIRLGYGGFTVVNLFAYRTPYPAELKKAGYPIGEENDTSIAAAIESAKDVCFAWGLVGQRRACRYRVEAVRAIAKAAGKRPFALRMTDKTPHHPLMLPYDCAASIVDYEQRLIEYELEY